MFFQLAKTLNNRFNLATIKQLLPGITLSLTLAIAASFLAEHYAAPVMLFAILLGMGFHFLMADNSCRAGVEFCAKRLLQIGVALLGMRVTLAQISSLGLKPIVFVLFSVIATIACAVLIAKFLNKRAHISQQKSAHEVLLIGILTGGAVAICGASAALAISLTLPHYKNAERDTLFTVISVTVLSTVAMIFYPILFQAFGFDDVTSGVLIGMTIHDVAQVVGAGFAVSNEAGEIATYVKLLRVILLPVVVIALLIYFNNNQRIADNKVGNKTFPWFAVGFVLLLLINSTGVIPTTIETAVNDLSHWLLVTAIAALGVKTSLKKIMDCGLNQTLLVIGETVFLLILALLLIGFL